MKIVNMTPHNLTLYTPEGVESIPPSGKMIRARSVGRCVGTVGGLPLYETVFEGVDGAPAVIEGETYVVSAVALKALAAAGISTRHFVAPGTGPQDGAIRDADNRVVGITRFVREAN